MSKRKQPRFSGGYAILAQKEGPVHAHTWFRRLCTSAPGNWEVCGAAAMPRVIRHLDMHKHVDLPGPGEIIRGNTVATRYDYVYIEVEVPPEIYEGLEEV